jgi:iron(III) transport system substrate-binding protein
MKRILALLAALAFTSSVMAQEADWKKTWDDTLAAAKKEGSVAVVGSPDPVMRNEIIPKFTARYGIPVEFLAGSSGQIAGRVRTERSSGIYSVDVYLSGASTSMLVLYKDKLIDPLKPLMLLPEVTDGSKWKRGKPLFADPEGEYLLELFSNVDATIFINTDFVKPEEMKSVDDLLNPKWKGKIQTQDPNASGSGSNTSVHFYSQLGGDFIKKLYLDQKPTMTSDRRQSTDWLARGIYPICLTCRQDDVSPLQKEGFKLLQVFELDGLKNRVVTAPFLVSVANKAPHPNAARVFVNWLAGKEALEIYSRGYDAATLRTDVDESFLDPRVIPRPDRAYVDDTDLNWVSSGRKEAADKVRELLKKP